MSETTVWRVHLKTEGTAFLLEEKNKSSYDYNKLITFCIKDGMKNGIIGVGWSDCNDRVDDYEDIKRNVEKIGFSSPNSAIKAINAIRQMKENDLIWTRSDKQIYYLCRVTQTWLNTKPTIEHFDYDIANFVETEWIEIGTEDKVPGKVVASFRASASAQRVNDVDLISRYIWNKHSNGYKFLLGAEKKNNVWASFHSETIEEIVIIYLQVSKNLKVYTSTVKRSEKLYECIMVDTNGNLVFPQVKSGNECLCADKFIDIVENNESAIVYLFAVSQKYGSTMHERIKCIQLAELENFIKTNKKILPKRTKEWIEMYELLQTV